jgi:hypothetical protein
MLVALQLVGAATVPLNVTALEACVTPKFVPPMVTGVPTAAKRRLRVLITGAFCRVNPTPLLVIPPTFTTTAPLVAPGGTRTTMLVALQLLGVATIPLKVTELDPCVDPKSVPAIVTEAPAAPDVGLKLEMPNVSGTVNATPLLGTPPAFTTTLPLVAPAGTGTTMLVALQLVGVPAVPLKATVPCVAPKFVPVIVTGVPAAAELGLRLLIAGVETTVNAMLLLATPPAFTTTLPLVAPAGTGTTMLVALQLVGVAATPLNVTVPCVAPKFVPVMVTEVPTAAELGLRLLIAGVESTVNAMPLLATPPTVTTTLPFVAPAGTGATILVALQLVAVAAVPLNVTVPAVPKLVPAIVTEVPTTAERRLRLPIWGAVGGLTVMPKPWLAPR